VWRTIAGYVLSDEEVLALLTRGITDPIDGLRSKAGRAFRAALRLDATGKVVFAFAAPDGEAAAPPSGAVSAMSSGRPDRGTDGVWLQPLA
jgi:DNA topoisomerase-3